MLNFFYKLNDSVIKCGTKVAVLDYSRLLACIAEGFSSVVFTC